jgi:hypothetical protein
MCKPPVGEGAKRTLIFPDICDKDKPHGFFYFQTQKTASKNETVGLFMPFFIMVIEKFWGVVRQ